MEELVQPWWSLMEELVQPRSHVRSHLDEWTLAHYSAWHWRPLALRLRLQWC
jgi:hypothetical protein